jgi:hypothetical protein
LELEVADILAIHGLLNRYGHKLDGRDWTALAELFVEDGVLDFTPLGAPYVASGRPAVYGWFTNIGHPLAHHVTNIDIEEVSADGNEATVRSKWLCPQENGTCGGGDYKDIVVRTDTGWRFRERVGLPRPGAEPGGLPAPPL